MQYGTGITTKTVRGKNYLYVWKYDGEGHKTETYIGPADKAKNQRTALQTKLAYLEEQQTKTHMALTAAIRATREQLAELPTEKTTE